MMENRSFDHMFGRRAGVEGILDPKSGQVKPEFYNLTDRQNPDSEKYPAGSSALYAIEPVDVDKKGFGGPSHSFPSVTTQLYGADNPPSSAQLAEDAPLNGFVMNYIHVLQTDVHRTNPAPEEIQEAMSTFEPGRLPVMEQLAQEFCVCDHWHAEVPGPTQPNRLFTHAATSQGFTHNVWKNTFNVRTIYEELDKVGEDWGVFYFDLRDTDSFPQIKSRIDRVLQFDAFYQKAQSGTLPTYSFLCPRYNDDPQGLRANSQHAPYDVRFGEHLIADVYEALRNGPSWPNTLLIVTYDEHGGYYDHVSPPTQKVNPPDDFTSPTEVDKEEAQANPGRNGYLLKPNYKFGFDRLGLRVPTLLISPWIAKGTVDSNLYQHTSIFATLRDLYGVGTLTNRDKQAMSFTDTLKKLPSARTDCPTQLERPPMPDTGANFMQRPLTAQQTEMWPILSQLDGHPDSGKVTKPPPTRADAHKYITERLLAHERFHRARRRKAAFEVKPDGKGGYEWQLRSDSNEIIARSPKTYTTLKAAEGDIERIRDLAPYAPQKGKR
jgi:phospholipase C